MNYRKTPAALKKGILLFLCAGVFFSFSSCSLDFVTLREADEPHPIPQSAVETPAHDAPSPNLAELSEPEEENQQEIQEDAAMWSALYDEKYGRGSSEKLILTAEEIAAYNARTIEACPTMYDLTDFVPTEEMLAELKSYALPAGDHFDADGNLIGEEQIAAILANIDAEGLGEELTSERAVVVRRCDMKTAPTELGFYDWGDTQYSDIQSTELIFGTPVRILHRSVDGKFIYVQSEYYRGWIEADAAAVCGEEDFAEYCAPLHFVTVVVPKTELDGAVLDMGVVLTYESETADAYQVKLPARGEDGALVTKTADLPKTEAVRGYLPYTMQNYYNQAFACLGVPYGWGGADGGLDCSGFVCAVFRSFGIHIPRDTKEQKLYAGDVVDSSAMTADEVDAVLTGLTQSSPVLPTAIYTPGHVVLYLGKQNGVHTIIHAPQAGDVVKVATFDPNSKPTSIVAFH